MVYTTPDGGTIEAKRTGDSTDMHLRAADGRTVATLVLPAAEASALLRVLVG
jgi:hypothetical protein